MKTRRIKAVKKKVEKTLLRTILPWRLFRSGTRKYTRNVMNRKKQLIHPLMV